MNSSVRPPVIIQRIGDQWPLPAWSLQRTAGRLLTPVMAARGIRRDQRSPRISTLSSSRTTFMNPLLTNVTKQADIPATAAVELRAFPSTHRFEAPAPNAIAPRE